MEDLFQSLPKLLRAAGESEEVLEAASFVAWRRVAGEALRGCAVPFRLFNKRLIVSVPDTTWRKQLEQVSPQLVFRLNSLLGQAMNYLETNLNVNIYQLDIANSFNQLLTGAQYGYTVRVAPRSPWTGTRWIRPPPTRRPST